MIDLAVEIRLSGLVATNTTIDRQQLQTNKATLEKIGAGGLSGRPLASRSASVVAEISSKSHGSVPLIASGGIFTGEDALTMIRSGAQLIQVWTGFIYKGPSIVKDICKVISKQPATS